MKVFTGRIAAVLIAAIALSNNVAVAQTPEVYRRYENAAEIKKSFDKYILNSSITPNWIRGQNRFWYQKETSDGNRYIIVEAATGDKADAFNHEELARVLSSATEKTVDGNKMVLGGLEIYPDGRLEFSFESKRWIYTPTTGTISELPAVKPNYNYSPNKELGVFWKDDELWVETVATGIQKQLTFDSEPHYRYGKYPEAFYGAGPAPQVKWSPDSTKILTAQTDDRQVLNLAMVDYAPENGLRAVPIEYRAALPGDRNVTQFRLVVIDIATGQQIGLRYPTLPAVRMNDTPMGSNRIWWRKDSNEVYFLDIERGEKTVRVVAANPGTGETRELFQETADVPINVAPIVYAPAEMEHLPGSNQLIWYSERNGWANYYLYDLNTGKMIRAITDGQFIVRNLLHVDEVRRDVIIAVAGRTAGRDPYDREILRISLDGRRASEVLSASDADHEVSSGMFLSRLNSAVGQDADLTAGVSPSGDYFVETVQRVDRPSETVLRRRDGSLVSVIEQADISNLPENFRWPERLLLTAADGKTLISGVVFRPADYDPNKKYPVVDQIYGGPQVAIVPIVVAGGPASQIADNLAFSALGFVLVQIDGRGTALRDRAFSLESFGRAETASNIEDHIAFIKQLAARDPAIDLDRVGITGFSGGGYATALALMRYPDFFKVGVAGSGNYDQRIFWHGWGERYQGYPFVDAEYTSQAASTYASGLKGKLLLTHGMLDRGVHPSNIFQLLQAMNDANVDYDLLIEPRSEHSGSSYRTRRIWDYFVENLAGEEPPVGFKLPDPPRPGVQEEAEESATATAVAGGETDVLGDQNPAVADTANK